MRLCHIVFLCSGVQDILFFVLCSCVILYVRTSYICYCWHTILSLYEVHGMCVHERCNSHSSIAESSAWINDASVMQVVQWTVVVRVYACYAFMCMCMMRWCVSIYANGGNHYWLHPCTFNAWSGINCCAFNWHYTDNTVTNEYTLYVCTYARVRPLL